MAVLRTEVGYCADGLPQAALDYIDGLEELARDIAEQRERRSADAEASSSNRAVGNRRSDGLPPGSQRYRIVQHLSSLGLLSDEGQITDEIAIHTGIPLNSVSTRMSELVRDGWIEENGEGNGGKTRYRATDQARQHFERLEAEQKAAAAGAKW